jgi:uncharacterized membrane protein
MAKAIGIANDSATALERALNATLSSGRAIFALSIIALGVETFVVSRAGGHSLGPQYNVLSVLPWLPAIPWLAYVFGTIWTVCGLGLFFQRTVRSSALLLGTLLFLCTVILEVPKNAVDIGSISLRTIVFEPLSMACLAWLLPAPRSIPTFLANASRYLLAASLVIFGVDHFLALQFIANLLPSWIPWHVFWVAFFGVAFIAAALSIALNLLLRWGAACLGLMFGIWVVTLHLPRVLGLYGIPGAPHNPNEYSSLFIAVALWGGLWALADAWSSRH